MLLLNTHQHKSLPSVVKPSKSVTSYSEKVYLLHKTQGIMLVANTNIHTYSFQLMTHEYVKVQHTLYSPTVMPSASEPQ